MKRILILGAGILQTSVIRKAKEMGVYTVVADGDPDASGLMLADLRVVADITSPEQMFMVAQREGIHGVIHPCSEVAMETMGYINERMGLSGIDTNTAVLATNKEMMRRAFESNSAPSPISIGAKTEKEGWEGFISIGGDAIIKPSRNSGSRGVSMLDKAITKSDFSVAFNRAKSESKVNSVVIEEYVDGPEFSVEIVIWNNNIQVLAVTDKLTSGSPYFVELGHSQPSKFPDHDLIKIKNAAIEGCKALGLNWCVAHAEIKLQNDNPYIIEIGARLGGDFISTELVHLSTGIDMVAAAIDIALGKVPDLNSKHAPQGAAIRYFTPKPGKLTKLTNIDGLIDIPNIYQIEIYKKTGDVISEVKSSLDRSGHIIAVGKDANDAIINAETILNRIKYKVEK